MISRLTLLMKQAADPTDADFERFDKAWENPDVKAAIGGRTPEQMDPKFRAGMIPVVKGRNALLTLTNPKAATDPNSGYVPEEWMTDATWDRYLAWRRARQNPAPPVRTVTGSGYHDPQMEAILKRHGIPDSSRLETSPVTGSTPGETSTAPPGELPWSTRLAMWWGQNKDAVMPWLIGGGGALGAMMLYNLFSRNQEERRRRDSDREVVYLK